MSVIISEHIWKFPWNSVCWSYCCCPSRPTDTCVFPRSV